jgi:pyridoxine 5-phosphate synthase
MKKILLGVNIDHVATLRQLRGTSYPDLISAANQAIQGGADSITVHLREDRRHIQDKDVYDLNASIDVPLNLEMAMTDEMLSIAMDVKPKFCCIVPEKRQELTTEGGLDVLANADRVKIFCQKLATAGIQTSLFIDPEFGQIEAAVACGAPVIELHTGRYSQANNDKELQYELNAIMESAEFAQSLGIQVNAGHGLTYDNVVSIASIDHIVELNIGHSIIAQSIFTGLLNTVSELKSLIVQARK